MSVCVCVRWVCVCVCVSPPPVRPAETLLIRDQADGDAARCALSSQQSVDKVRREFGSGVDREFWEWTRSSGTRTRSGTDCVCVSVPLFRQQEDRDSRR